MADLRIKGDTSGYVDLVAPDVAGSQVINLERVVTTDASGNLGVGTVTPGTALHVSTTNNEVIRVDASDGQQSSIGFAQNNDVKFLIGNDLYANGGRNFFIYDEDRNSTCISIDGTGNVGIGTTAPADALHVSGGYLKVQNGTADAGLKLVGRQVDNHSSVRFYDNDGTTVIGNILYYDSGMYFGTGGGGTTSAEMHIQASTGNVGIGTASPDGPLHIKSGNNGTLKLDSTLADGNGSFTTLAFARNGTSKWRVFQYGNDSRLGFINDIAGNLEQFSLASDGNVGVGVATPAAKLEVAGEVRAPSFNGVSTGTRNLLINGDMQIAQRSTDYTILNSSYQYQALDRWGNYYSTNRVQKMGADIPATWGGTAQYKSVMRITQGSSIQNLYTFQWVEGLGYLLRYNTPFSISFKARANRTGQMTVQTRYGDVGAGSSAVSDTVGTANLTTSWQTFKFENITQNRSYLNAGLWMWGKSTSFTNTGDWLEITDVQLELGPVATPYEQKTEGMEFLACQRYYQKLIADHQGGSAPSDHGVFMGHVWGSTVMYWVHHFSVPMRAGPVLKLGQAVADTGRWYSGGVTADTATNMTIQSGNQQRVEMSGQLASSLSAGNGAWMRLKSNGAWIAFDAEYL